MSATSAGALKALIEAQGLGLQAYREQAPEGTEPPYVTIDEAVSITPDQSGDNGAGATVRELADVHLWQLKRNPATNLLAENYPLPDALARALHGNRLATAPTKVYGLHVRSRVRVPDPDTNRIHDVVTVQIDRVL